MKYCLLSIFLWVTCGSPLSARNEHIRHLSPRLQIGDFKLEPSKEGKWQIRSETHRLYFNTEKSAHALPHILVYVLVGDSETYKDVEVLGTDTLIGDNIVLADAPCYAPTDGSTAAPQHLIDAKEASKKIESIMFIGSHDMGGYRMLSFHVYPFKYDIEKRSLYFTKNLKINLTTEKNNAFQEKGSAVKYKNARIRNAVEDMVINRNEMDTLYSCDRLTVNPQDLNTPWQCKYLIITCDSLKEAFLPLAYWKHQKGVPARIMTIEEIETQYSGQTQQERIKSAISDLYENNVLEYVLLGGDVGIVPAQMCYIRLTYRTRISTSPIPVYGWVTKEKLAPADLYYACMGNLNWDTNGNGLYGEIGDNVDVTPEINVTRAAVNDRKSTTEFVNRIVLLRKNANMGCQCQ